MREESGEIGGIVAEGGGVAGAKSLVHRSEWAAALAGGGAVLAARLWRGDGG